MDEIEEFLKFMLVVVVIIGMFVLAASPFVWMCWNQAEVEARLYNTKYGTSYVQRDFFFAGDTIKEYLNKGPQSTLNANVNLKQE